MKAKYLLFATVLILTVFGSTNYASAQDKKSDVSISESDNIYKFNSKYDKAKTRDVQEYMTESLKETDFKFTNTQLDAQVVLTGGINFYIRSYDGELVLKFDKKKNTADHFAQFKKMCEGIRDIIRKS